MKIKKIASALLAISLTLSLSFSVNATTTDEILQNENSVYNENLLDEYADTRFDIIEDAALDNYDGISLYSTTSKNLK